MKKLADYGTGMKSIIRRQLRKEIVHALQEEKRAAKEVAFHKHQFELLCWCEHKIENPSKAYGVEQRAKALIEEWRGKL